MTNKLKWYGDKAKSIVTIAGKEALQKCAADLQRKSAEQAPIDKGDLRANCSVSTIEQSGNKAKISVGYNLPYALVQHEHLEYRHLKGGKAKYLEDPFNANENKYNEYIKAAIKKALKAR